MASVILFLYSWKFGKVRYKKEKLILLWKPIYKDFRYMTHQILTDCPSENCKFTEDRNDSTEADAIFFEVESLYELPPRNVTGQIWIYSDVESPAYRPNGIREWNGLFNWTMTYRRDSDIQLFYGGVLKNNAEKTAFEYENSMNKSEMLWLVSNCQTPGKRELFVRNFTKYFNIEIVGKCGKTICGVDDKCEYKMLENKYKYYFAAENANCRDYVSEKTFRTLGFPIIPVVRGGSNYSLYLPPNSFVDSNSFKSPSGLASYLRKLEGDNFLYNKYFQWKRFFHGVIRFSEQKNPYCELCERIQNHENHRRLYRNLHDWVRGNSETGTFCNKGELVKLDL
ncbi:hypothetical protein FSP39_002972 [Pinctada imbricata]|uniref:Fucosyltransferase n=1 Tax=Pinctada imbricata TaxID=66713 RepID=A0AA88Y753_PINIB|nr:hypothetical protein FSP39_002972 [Pinctada imbricata]